MKRPYYLLLFFVFCAMLISPLVFSSRTDENTLVESIKSQGFVQTAGASLDPSWPEKQPRWSYQAVGTVNVVALSSNGAYVLIGTSDGYVYLFSTTSNIPLDAAKIEGSVTVLDVSYDGKYVAAATGNLVKVYNVTGTKLNFLWSFTNNPGSDGGVYSLSFSDDGLVLVVGTWARGFGYIYQYYSYSYVHVLDIAANTIIWSKQISEVTPGDWGSNRFDYVSVDISSDGQYIVAGSTYNHNVYLFNKTSSTPLHIYDTASSVNSVSISSDGQYFISGDSMVRYFRNCVSVPQWSYDIGGSVSSVSISRNATFIVATGGGKVFLLRNDSAEVWRYDLGANVGRNYFSSDGNYIITSSGNYVLLFSIVTSDPVWSYNTENAVNSVSISAEAKYIVAGSGSIVYLFDISYNPDLTPTSIVFSNINPRDGETIIISVNIQNIGNLESPIAFVRFYYDQILMGTRHVPAIKANSETMVSISCTVSPSGKHDIKAIIDYNNLVYESEEMNNILTEGINVTSSIFVDSGANPTLTDITEMSIVNSISTSEDGYYTVIGASDGYVYLFFRNHTSPVWSYKADGPIDAVSISGDGSYLVAVSKNTAYIFSRTNNEPLWSFFNNPGSDGGIYSLAFSCDGRLLVVGTWARGFGYIYQYYSYSYVHVLDIAANTIIWSKQISEVTPGDWGSNRFDYVSVDISSDGQYIVAGSTYNHKFYYYVGEVSYDYDTGAPVNSVSISFDGSFAVAASNRVYYFSKSVVVPLWSRDIGGTVNSVSISSNATYIVATRGTYIYLLKNDNSELWNYDIKSNANQALISKDASCILARSGNYVYLFSRTLNGNPNTSEHEAVWSFDTKSTVKSISISYDGRYSAIASGGKMYYFDVLHKADLIPTYVSFSKNLPNEGETIIINVTVYNIGAYKSYYTKVVFYDDGNLIGNVQLDPISPNASAIVTVNYTCEPNIRTIKVAVDPDNLIYESNKTNNQLTTTINVNARPVPVILSTPTNATPSSLKLSWAKNEDIDFARYEIYLSEFPGKLGSLVTAIPDQSITSYTVTGLNASTTYYFIVRVVDKGNAYSDSNQVSGTTPPKPITLYTPTNPKPTSLDLSWTKNTDQNFAKYEIYQSTISNQLGNMISTITNQSITTYTVKNLVGSTTYYFTVRVVNLQGLFSDSNQVSGTTSPTPVTLYNPSNPTMSSLTISWSRNTDKNFLKYELYVSKSNTTLGTLLTSFTDQTITTYNITGLEPATAYYFVVRVVNPQGLLSDSNQVSGTTLSDYAIFAFPTSQVVIPGESASYYINITSYGPSTPIVLTASGLPSGITFSFSPSSVIPNGTSTLTISASSSAQGGTYTLTISCKRGASTRMTTVELIVVTITGTVAQEHTETITFSLAKTLQKSESFSVAGTSVILSASVDISLTMPTDITTQSNATLAKKGTGAWVIISTHGKSATIRITVTVSVSIGGKSQSVTKTWTKTFTTPIGSSEITFDTFSIPALDVVIGQVTVDLTPKVILFGRMDGKITISGPAVANFENLSWASQGGKRIIYVTFNEDKDVQVSLSSASLSLTQLTLSMNVGATIKPVIGSPQSFDLGTLQLPISTAIPSSGSPDSLTVARFSSPSTGPQIELSPIYLKWIFVAITLIAVITGVAIAVKKRRRKSAPIGP